MDKDKKVTTSDDLRTEGGIITFAPKAFPCEIKGGGASITLQADGSWTGDKEAFIEAVSEVRIGGPPFTTPILWLIANALRNSK